MVGFIILSRKLYLKTKVTKKEKNEIKEDYFSTLYTKLPLIWS